MSLRVRRSKTGLSSQRGVIGGCRLVRVRVGVRSIIYYFLVNLYLCLVITVSVFWFDQKFFYGRRCIL